MKAEDGYLYLLRTLFWDSRLVDGAFVSQDEVEIIRQAIESLTPREAFVIISRFLNKQTLKETAAQMPRLTDPETNKKIPNNAVRPLGVSTERIRQIEAKAIRKLRHPSRSRPFLPIAKRIFVPLEGKNA